MHGSDRYTEAVEATLTIAREVAAGIEASDHLRLVKAPELSVLLFQRPGWDAAQYQQWSSRAAHEGWILCVPTTWRGETVLRLAFVNPDTRAERVLAMLETLR